METNASGQREILAELKQLDPPDELAAQTAALTKNAGLIANDLESLVPHEDPRPQDRQKAYHTSSRRRTPSRRTVSSSRARPAPRSSRPRGG